MQRSQIFAALAVAATTSLAGVSCKSKSETKPGAGSAVVAVKAPVSCPPGNAVENGACVAAVTAEKVEAVAQQATRLDEFAKLLDSAEVVSAPVELLGGFRQLDVWKNMIKLNTKLQVVDEVAAALDTGVKELRALKVTLADSSAKLGNLRGELDGLLKSPAVAQPLAALQSNVAAKLHGVLDPLEAQITKVAQSALGPAAQKLSDVGDLVLGACAMGKVTGGGDSLKQLCDQAKTAFGSATTFLADFKTKPLALFNDLSGSLESKLSNLLDTQSQKLLQEAQVRVNGLLNLPAGGGSASGPGSSAGSSAGSGVGTAH